MKFIVLFFLLYSFNSCSNTNDLGCLQKWSEERVVEGYVSNYSPMNKEGHGSNEIFWVDSVSFAYSDFAPTGFYNNSCVYGGLICRNGQKVRITYKTQCDVIHGITKIEILKNRKTK